MTPRLKYELARQQRKAMSPPEVQLLVRLRSRATGNLVFRRQHPVGPYVLDFYCAEVKLAVEVDGVHHTEDDQRQRDETRDKWLAEQGIRTLRIPAFEIMLDADEIATGVYAVALERVGKV